MADEALHQLIGKLTEAAENSKNTLQHLMRMWENQEKNASEGRRILHEKVDAMNTSVVALTGRVTSVETTLTKVQPAVKEFESQREQQKGAMKVGKVIWAAMLAACGTMGTAIGYGAAHLFGGSPPPGH